MVAISTVIAGIGLATQAFGLFQSNKDEKKQRQQQLALQQQQVAAERAERARFSAVQSQLAGQITAERQQQAQFARQAERQRQLQQNLEATRARRQTIRNAIIQQGTSINAAANAGFALAGSSIREGARANIFSESLTNLVGNFQAQDIGNTLFDINENIFDSQTRENQFLAQLEQARAQSGLISSNISDQGRLAQARLNANTSNTGRQIANAGQLIQRSATNVGKLGTFLFSPRNSVTPQTSSQVFRGNRTRYSQLG